VLDFGVSFHGGSTFALASEETIQSGADADIVMVDANKERVVSSSTHHMLADAPEGRGR
jgi:dihydroorotase-like cyclic amidohydrolase